MVNFWNKRCDSVNFAMKYVIQNLKKFLAFVQNGKKKFQSWFSRTNYGMLTFFEKIQNYTFNLVNNDFIWR